MPLTQGTRLGPYEIVAEVYRATDSHLKRSVAIKVLPASVAGDADRLARFQREAEVLAALNHLNIAAIYGLEKTPELTALVMELVEGEGLSAHIARGPIPLADALPIAEQIADALEAAHEQGMAERNVPAATVAENPNQHGRLQRNARYVNDLASSSVSRRLRPLAPVCRFSQRDDTRNDTRRVDPLGMISREP